MSKTGLLQDQATQRGTKLRSNGNWDAFLTRLNAKGDLLWSKRYGDGSHQFLTALSFDPFGNALVGGHFEGHFHTGASNHGCHGYGADTLIMKVKPNGATDWSKAFHRNGGKSGNHCGSSARDDFVAGVTGNQLGQWHAAISFDNRRGCSCGCYNSWKPLNLGNGNLAGGWNDHYNVGIGQFAAGGKTVWGAAYGGGDEQYARAVASDGANNTLMLAQIRGTYTIGSKHSASGWDLVLVKYDSKNKIVWSKKFGGPGDVFSQTDMAAGLDVDSKNNSYVTGTFQSSALNLGGPAKLSTAGSYDGFLTKRTP